MPGTLDESVSSELWIWRPILAGKVTLTEVKTGVASVRDLFALNALLDMQADIEAEMNERVRG